MKKIITLLVILSFFIPTTFSQVFGESGSNWKFDVLQFYGPEVWEINYKQNITEQGKLCQVYEVTRHKFSWDQMRQYSKYIESEKLDEHIIYVSGDTVFQYRNGQFYILYNFSASVNDTWDLGYDNNQFGDSCGPSIVEVVAVGDTTINGEKLRYFKLDQDLSTSSYFMNETVIEKFGHVQYPFPLINTFCTTAIPEVPQVRLKCFESDSFLVYDTGVNGGDLWANGCDIKFWSGVEDQGIFRDVQVFPNPSNGEVTIDLSSITGEVKLIVYNQLGAFVEESTAHSSEGPVRLSIPETGVFFLELRDRNGSVKRERLVVLE